MTIKLNSSTAGSVALEAPASTTSGANIAFKLPVADGTAGQVLMTDGSGNLSWVDNSLSNFTRFRLTAQKTGNQDPITSSFGTADDGGRGNIAPAVSQSSGIFTFPTTGIYKVQANWSLVNPSNNVTWCDLDILFAQDGTNYNAMARSVVGHSSGYYMQPVTTLVVDVTNTSNAKVKFKAVFADSDTRIRGNGTSDYTYFDFMRIGDT
jgi:hypothetical protein|tara:strand:- start:897 stop:1520 length:624 start_codon:yes stop_codon:yes gene_type:complete